MSERSANTGLVAVVPVRVGSKGLPGKNLRLLDGVPLYMHAVRQGLRTTGQVLLSTDIPEISQDDLPEGCTLCSRPADLAADETPMAPVIEHLITEQGLAGKTLLLLQATSPLRSDTDILEAIALQETGQHDLVMSVVARDRGVLKYGTLDGSSFQAVREQTFCFQNRQSLPAVFGPNGAVYVFGADQFLASGGFPTGRIGAIQMSIQSSVDIDTEDDFRLVEYEIRAQAAKIKQVLNDT